MTVDLVLYNAKVYVDSRIVEANIAIDNGRIVKLTKKTNLPPSSTRIDLKGNLVLPGLIDIHAHFRDQQLKYKEDFFSGSSAAAAGGFTLAIDMPNNNPVTMDAASLRERMRIAKEKTIINLAFFSAFPLKIDELSEIVAEGAIAFKLYLSQRIGGLDIEDDNALLKVFKEIDRINIPIAVHAEDKKTLENKRKLIKQEECGDLRSYLKIHTPIAEATSIKRIFQLIKTLGAGTRVHFCHVSSNLGLMSISKAKNAGFNFTCEVTPHHLFLSHSDLERLGAKALTSPPVRTINDNRALWFGLKEGIIDVIASDHAPHILKEKNICSFCDVSPGIPGFETLLPLMLTQVNNGHINISELVRFTSERPAEIFNLKDRGIIWEGYRADIVVIDLHREQTIDSSKFYSKAKYSPFDGFKVKGKPIKTFVNGKLVMDEGLIVGKSGMGSIVRDRH